MAVPKRRTSKRRKRLRRTHKKLDALALTKCDSCGEFKRPHHMCECGFYKEA